MSHELHQDNVALETNTGLANALITKTDQTTDVVKQAFVKFRQAISTLNYITDKYNSALHMTRLDSNGLLDSYKLSGVISEVSIQDNSITYDTTSNKGKLANDSVTTTEIEDNCIRKNHIDSSTITNDATINDDNKLMSNKGLENLKDLIKVKTSNPQTYTHGEDVQSVSWPSSGDVNPTTISRGEDGEVTAEWLKLRWDSVGGGDRATWWNLLIGTNQFNQFGGDGPGDLTGRTNVGTNAILSGIRINNVRYRFDARQRSSAKFSCGGVLIELQGRDIGY